MADEKTRRVISPELLVRLLALAIVAAALFTPPPYKTWLAAGGCALAASVFLTQAIRSRPTRRSRWLNFLFAGIFGVTAVWIVAQQG